MVNKISYYFSLLTLVMAFIMIVYFAYLFMWPFRPLEYYEGHGLVTKTEYCRGETIEFRVHLKKNINTSVEVQPAFIDGIIYQLPSFYGNHPVGVLDFWNYSIEVPRALPTGVYYLTTTASVKINHFRDISYFTKSAPFKVIDCQK